MEHLFWQTNPIGLTICWLYQDRASCNVVSIWWLPSKQESGSWMPLQNPPSSLGLTGLHRTTLVSFLVCTIILYLAIFPILTMWLWKLRWRDNRYSCMSFFSNISRRCGILMRTIFFRFRSCSSSLSLRRVTRLTPGPLISLPELLCKTITFGGVSKIK